MSRTVAEKTKAVEIYDTIFSDFQQFLLSGSGQTESSESMDSIVQVLRQALGASLGDSSVALDVGVGESPIPQVFDRIKTAINRFKSVDHATESNLSCTVMEQLRLEMEKNGRLAECVARLVTLAKTLLEEVREEVPAQVLWSVFKDRYVFLEESGSLDEAVDLTEDAGFSNCIKRLIGESLVEWQSEQKRKAIVTVEETTQVTISFPPSQGMIFNF